MFFCLQLTIEVIAQLFHHAKLINYSDLEFVYTISVKQAPHFGWLNSKHASVEFQEKILTHVIVFISNNVKSHRYNLWFYEGNRTLLLMADTSLAINYEQYLVDKILHVSLKWPILYKAPFYYAAGTHPHNYAAHVIPKQLMCLACTKAV